MVWVRLDDHFDENPKIAAVGPLGIALWAVGLAYCNRNLTDGFIPWTSARRLLSWEYQEPARTKPGTFRVLRIGTSSGMQGADVDSEQVIDLLVDAGLWEEVDGGYRVHDFNDYQPDRKSVEAEREASKERMKRSRERRNGSYGDVAVDVAAQPEANFARSSPAPVPDPDPVPDPEGSIEPSSSRSIARVRAEDDQEPLALDLGATFDEAQTWLGRSLSKTELERVSSAIEDYGEERVRLAIQTAKDAGNTGLNYMLTVCRNNPNGVSKSPAAIGPQWGTDRFTNTTERSEIARFQAAKQRLQDADQAAEKQRIAAAQEALLRGKTHA